MGGRYNHFNTTQIYDDGGSTQGFNLVESSYYSCAIADPKSGSVILTGGRDLGKNQTHQRSKSVIRYGEDGFIEYLPEMVYTHEGHDCAGFYNDDESLVNCASSALHYSSILHFVGSHGC